MPVTGSLLFAAPGCRLADFSAGGIVMRVSHDSAGLLLTGVCRVLRIVLQINSRTEMAMWSDSPCRRQAGLVLTSTLSYRSPVMLWRHMSISIPTEFMN